MKLALTLLFALFCLAGCGGGSTSYAGTWLVDDAGIPSAWGNTTLPPNLLKLRQQLVAFRLTLKADGSYEAVSVPGIQNGHWKLQGGQIMLDTPPTKLDISDDGSYLKWAMVEGRAPLNLYKQKE
ncbi:MAG TPA: hypothetical protein VHE55_03585 [Fimbriimonadaceae bacterium]|nr:hypothetical protein [Fimbriimonadaceae bacterium]